FRNTASAQPSSGAGRRCVIHCCSSRSSAGAPAGNGAGGTLRRAGACSRRVRGRGAGKRAGGEGAQMVQRPFALRCSVRGVRVSELTEAIAAARSRYTLLRRLLPTPDSRGVVFGLWQGRTLEEDIAEIARHFALDAMALRRIVAEAGARGTP